jgi:glyoxylase-like metal-dependent hydrolase (beta-lactamase superfamily II)/8-oxo-dGTP pyrophosphatase MutT (NUDIX family)
MSAIHPAASVLVARGPHSPEVYLVARSPALRFMGGMVAFPGGKVGDEDNALARPADGLTAHHVCAVRELFEETGILLVRGSDGRTPPKTPEFDASRRELLAGSLPFADLLRRNDWHLDPADLAPAGHLVTPPFAPLRFDTAFFTATLPAGQQATVWPGELTEGWWASAEEALRRWREGAALLTPPTVSILQAIEGMPVDALPARLAPLLADLDRGGVPPIWFSPGVRMLPLECQGLPPTTHTNAFLVGTGPVYLIDPGPVAPHEQAKLFEVADNHRPDAVLLTHHHPDHIGAAAVSAQRYGVPVLAHALTAELLKGKVAVDRLVADGESLDLGAAPHGRGRWAMQALFTPGHAPGHLALYQPDYQLLFAGDMVSTLSSMIIHPKDGDVALYLASLERLKGYPARLLLPAHGGASTKAAALLDEAIAHRRQREEQLLAALSGGPRSLEELALELYRGFPESVLKLARWQIHAGLIKLEREGRAVADGDRWRLA